MLSAAGYDLLLSEAAAGGDGEREGGVRERSLEGGCCLNSAELYSPSTFYQGEVGVHFVRSVDRHVQLRETQNTKLVLHRQFSQLDEV